MLSIGPGLMELWLPSAIMLCTSNVYQLYFWVLSRHATILAAEPMLV